MALGLVSPLISFVAQKAGSSLIDEFCQMHGMEKNHQKLKRQLLAVQAVVANAEERGATDPAVQAWLKELNAAAYKAEDVLDEFQYEALRQKALGQESSSSMKKVIRAINLQENPIVFRYKMSKKLVKVLEKINEIISEMNTFGFIAHDSQPVISRPQTHSCVIESEVIGRDNEKENIMDLLLDPNREMEKVSILPIVGMGGAGKTTLAQLVYNEKNVQDHFKLKMWVCVSNDFNIVNILRSIIEQIPNVQCASTSNLEVLQKQLRESFVDKKYLLVLDDVWNEKRQQWDDLKTILMCDACLGSIIVVTTRNKKVASMMGTLPIHDLAMLSEADSWNLFRKRAFREAEETESFVEIGRKIVDKCGGLPLVLKVIGGLMITKRDVREWCSVLDNKIWYDDASNNGILPALKLSYDHLPGYMKQCFTFCAMFPMDYVFQKETLIQLWMANGFIQNDKIKHLEDQGEYIFSELCLRSFFQEIKEVKSLYGKIEVQCKMHDLMHDLAKHIAGKQYASSTLEVEKDQVQHLLITKNHEPNNLSVLREFPIIRTCLFDTDIKNISDNVNSNSMKSISLRALKMKFRGGGQLPKELGYMKHLRYLDLTGSSFDYLPETLTSLYNLQTLNLTDTNVSILPEGMRYMISLENLIFEGCRPKLKKMPISIGRLKNLRTLTKYIVDHDPGRSIEELKNLNLHGWLILCGLENVRNRNEAEAANMVLKTKLHSLKLCWHSSENEETTARNDVEVLEGLKPFDLERLSMSYYAGFEFAVWMKDTFVMRNLRILNIDCCHNCTKLPPLPFLTNLNLNQMRNLVYLCNIRSSVVVDRERLIIFPNLKKLEISCLDNLEGWHEQDHKLVEFPQLEGLRITECPKLQSIPFTPSLIDFHIGNPGVKFLQISNMTMGTPSKLGINLSLSPTEPDSFRPPKNVVDMEVTGLEKVIPLEANNEENCQNMALRNLTIRNSNCFFSCGTSKLSLGFWKYFAFLERLEIYSCSALSLWPAEEFKSLKCLKGLEIDNCKNLTYSSKESFLAETYEEEHLPGLERLIISRCPKLVKIPNCSKSLNYLVLWGCPSVTKDGIKWLKNLYELKKLSLEDCENLKSLPDGLELLTSLQDLTIVDCHAMESFPQGLQQRLPALQILEITGCPVLVRRCENGGDYQHLVAAIPDKYVTSEICYLRRTCGLR